MITSYSICLFFLYVFLSSSFQVNNPLRLLTRSKNQRISSVSSSNYQSYHNHIEQASRSRIDTLEMISEKTKAAPKIIIAGAPAAGKGTQCEIIKSNFGVIHLSTGDILRAAVKEGTELGKKAKAFMDAGQLVPDELIIGVICDRLKQQDCLQQGWLLDGFPRTRAQAEALASAGLVPDSFILLDVPEEVLVERVTGRRTDPVTGRIYHLKFSPPESDEIAKRLVQRSDDTAEKIVVRYREFQSHIDAIKSFYESKTIRVDGSMNREEVSSRLLEGLQKNLAIKV
jgi:adenylate kinase